MSGRSKYWCFTVNNPEDYELGPRQWPEVKYCIWQKERGENGTPHIQGYVVFVGTKRLEWVKRHCSARAHWEFRRGTHAQAKAYCEKEETRIEGPHSIGDDADVPNGSGVRTDLSVLKTALDENDLPQVWQDHFSIMLKYYRGADAYLQKSRKRKRNFRTEVFGYFGETGIGKTYHALNTWPEAYWFPKGGKWWLNYNGENVVIFDEFVGDIQYTLLLRLLDCTPLQVEDKGTYVEFTATVVVILSNYSPLQWYPKVPTLKPLLRRLNEASARGAGMFTRASQNDEWRARTFDISEYV